MIYFFEMVPGAAEAGRTAAGAAMTAFLMVVSSWLTNS